MPKGHVFMKHQSEQCICCDVANKVIIFYYSYAKPTGFPVGDFLCPKSFLLDSAPIYHNKYRAKLLTKWSDKRKGC